MQELTDIDRILSPQQSQFQSVDTTMGTFWRSQHNLEQGQSYNTSLPAGLHLGAGIAAMQVKPPGMPWQQCSGPIVSLVHCLPNHNEQYETRVEPGEHLSCGLYVPELEQQPLADSLSQLLDRIPHRQHYFSARVSPFQVQQLCAPLNQWQDEFARRMAGESRVHLLLAQLAESLAESCAPLKNHQLVGIAKVRLLLEDNLASALSLAQLADCAGMSVRTMTSLFRRHYQMSVTDYLTRLRLQKAVQLLESGLPVSQVADRVGYSLPYFSAKFRQVLGVAPSQIFRLPDNINKAPD